MDRPRPPVAWVVAAAAAGLQAAIVVVLVAIGLADDGVADVLRTVVVAAVYGFPVGLAVLALNGRHGLLLAAGTTSVALALFGFSLHSLVFLPAGVVHLVAFARLRPHRAGPARTVAAAVLGPVVAIGGVATLFVHPDPVCTTTTASGEVVVERGTAASGPMTLGPDEVARRCSSDTVVGWEAGLGLALVGGGLGGAARIRTPARRARR